MVDSIWRAKAQRKWGRKAEWIQGDGQYALLAWCMALAVTLYPTRAEAEKEKKFIDTSACGVNCIGDHEIVDLSI